MRKCLIFLIAAAFLAVSVMPATAQDDGAVSINGGVMLQTTWNKVDSTMGPLLTPSRGNNSTTDLIWGIIAPGTSIGFNFKKGDISGEVVLRPFTSVSRMYGAWNFGAGTLTIGNFNTPAQRPQAALHHLGGKAKWAGNFDLVSRNQGLMLTFPLGGGTLKFAGLKQGTHTAFVNTAATYQEGIIPKLEASYDVKFGGFNLWLGGGYQAYDETVVATNTDTKIKSWILGAYGSYGFGPVTLNGGIHTAQNPAEYGFTGGAPTASIPLSTAATAVYNTTSLNVIDSDWLGFHLSAGWKISDMLTLQAGYGANEFTRSANPSLGEIVEAEDTTAFYYINMPIFAAKGLTITPEIGVTDEKDVKSPTTGLETPQGKATYYGVRWFIRF
jgi:hypothetical protein